MRVFAGFFSKFYRKKTRCFFDITRVSDPRCLLSNFCVKFALFVVAFAADKSLDYELGTTDCVDANSVQLKHWNFDHQPFLRGTLSCLYKR